MLSSTSTGCSPLPWDSSTRSSWGEPLYLVLFVPWQPCCCPFPNWPGRKSGRGQLMQVRKSDSGMGKNAKNCTDWCYFNPDLGFIEYQQPTTGVLTDHFGGWLRQPGDASGQMWLFCITIPFSVRLNFIMEPP